MRNVSRLGIYPPLFGETVLTQRHGCDFEPASSSEKCKVERSEER